MTPRPYDPYEKALEEYIEDLESENKTLYKVVGFLAVALVVSSAALIYNLV